MQPEAGGRFEARLLAEEATGARFAVELSIPGGLWTSEASVSLTAGDVEWRPWTGDGEPPEWLCRYLRSALRSAWRAHAEQGWPRRITRWRAAPDGERAGGADEKR